LLTFTAEESHHFDLRRWSKFVD